LRPDISFWHIDTDMRSSLIPQTTGHSVHHQATVSHPLMIFVNSKPMQFVPISVQFIEHEPDDRVPLVPVGDDDTEVVSLPEQCQEHLFGPSVLPREAGMFDLDHRVHVSADEPPHGVFQFGHFVHDCHR
jgi:hypothetical protein